MKCVIVLKLSKEVQIKLCSYDVTGLYNDSFSKVKLTSLDSTVKLSLEPIDVKSVGLPPEIRIILC